MNYYVYIQGYKRNNKLYLYIGSHCHSDNEGFYDYKGSGSVLVDGFEWVTKHILQYYDSIEEMYAGEVYWIRRFAEKFGVSGWVYRHYNDDVQCITDFVNKYHRQGGLLLNVKDTTDAPLQTSNARVKAVSTMHSNGHFINMPWNYDENHLKSLNSRKVNGNGDCMYGCHTDNAEQLRSHTIESKYDGDRMGMCHTKEAHEKSNVNSHKTISDVYDGDACGQMHTVEARAKAIQTSKDRGSYHVVAQKNTKYFLLSDGTHGSYNSLADYWKIKPGTALDRILGRNDYLQNHGISVVATKKGSDFTDEEIQQLLQN